MSLNQDWAVSAADIRALAAQLAPISTDPVYGGQATKTRVITDEDIDKWVGEVGAVVDVVLYRRDRLTEANKARIEKAAVTVIKNGSAAYLVDAAAPTRAGVNDNSSYGAVLWTRYQTSLDTLVAQLNGWLADGGGADQGVSSGGAATFQETIFADDQEW